MDLISLSRLENFVDRGVRSRGQAYADQGLVTITGRPGPGKPLLADVEGSEIYGIRLEYDDGLVLASCTCPYFESEMDLCKHVWATLVVAARLRLSFGGSIDDLLADDEAVGGRPPLPTSKSARGRISGAPQSRPVPSRWRADIQSLAMKAGNDSGGEVTPPGSQIVYVVNAITCGASFVFEVSLRSPKKDGEWSKPKPVRLTSANIASLSDPLDREILSLLHSSDRYGSWGSIESAHAISWPAASYLVPKLAATGRLFVRPSPGELHENVTFDDGEPWSLGLVVTEADGKYLMNGILKRGEVTMPLRSVLAITRGGFVITRASIARFSDGGGADAWASVLRRAAMEVPRSEAAEFAAAVMRSGIAPPDGLPDELQWHERSGSPRGALQMRKQGAFERTLFATVSFEYDGLTIDPFTRSRAIFDEKHRSSILRDAAAESRLLEALARSGFTKSHGITVMIASSRWAEAMTVLIEGGWEVRGTEGLYRAAGELDLTLTSGIDWFDLEATVTFGPERVPLPRLLAALSKGEAFVKLDDGSLGLISTDWKKQLEPFLALAAEKTEGGVRFRGNQVLLLDALLASRPRVQFDEVFDRARRAILEVKLAAQEPPKSFQGELRVYQKEGLGWFSFLRELSFGGCLADDMGLGKTVQVLALLEERRTRKDLAPLPSLVVMPRSLVFNWKGEAARFTPGLRVLDHTAPDRLRGTDHFSRHDVVLTTYGLLRKDVEMLAAYAFDYVILDEAQAIKNAVSQSAKAALLIPARHRLALSGTPVENHLGELASIFEFLNPGMLRGRSGRVSILLRDAGKKGDEAEVARSMLARALRPFILRRTKGQVARELPDRVEQTVFCELEPKQRKLYDELRDFYRASLLNRVEKEGMNRSKMHVLEALLRLRQAACHPGLVDRKRIAEPSAKMETLFAELEIILAERHKVIVFSQFTSLLAIVRMELVKRGISFAYLDGKSRDRQEQVRTFQEDANVPLFLVSLKAGGLGLNLTAAGYVFLLDPWWNPAVEAQAIDRAHRIGQTRNVFAYRLVAKDTIEEKILQLQQRKRALADAIISEENSVLRQMTAEDLDLLLS